jgi:hypothetical protein
MTAMPQTVNEFDRVLPGTIDGWTKGPATEYTPQTLSNYIDGGAELYLSYNFKSALSLKYTDAAENEITVDIFDMGASADAFGVFAHSRETVDASVGQGSEYAEGLLTFWKDRYYVSILTYPVTPARKDVIFRLARAIEGAIKAEGPLPPILALLPAEDLRPETVHFFHHYIWINSFYFVSNENVLDIAADTPAALAQYKRTGSNVFLLLVRYPTAARAAAAAGKFRRTVLGGAADGMAKLKDGRWSGIREQGDLLKVVFGAPDEAAVRETLAKVKT